MPPRASVLRAKVGRIGKDLDAAIEFAGDYSPLIPQDARDTLKAARDALARAYDDLSD